MNTSAPVSYTHLTLPLRVLGPRVLIAPDIESQEPTKTPSGLLLAPTLEAAVNGRDAEVSYVSGTIVAVGTHHVCRLCGTSGRDFTVGDRVAFSWKSGQDVIVEGTPYVIMPMADVLAVLEETYV